MAYSVYLSGAGFDVGKWTGKIQDLIEQEAELELLPLSEILMQEMLPSSHFLFKGSTTGLRLELVGENRVLLEISVLGSRLDWAFLFRVVEEALRQGALLDEDGDFFTQGFIAESSDRAFREWWAVSHASCKELAVEHGALSLGILGGLALELNAALFDLPDHELLQRLEADTLRICSAYPATLLKTTVGNCCVWPCNAVLIPKECEYVLLPSFSGGSTPPSRIGLPFLMQVMHPLVENLQSHWYLPELNLENAEHIARIEQLRAGAETDTDQVSEGTDGTDEQGDAEMDAGLQILMDGPVLVFLFVAGADGEVDQKEFQAFIKTMSEAAPGGKFGELFSACVGTLGQDPEANLSRIANWLSAQPGPASGIFQLAAAIEEIPGDLAGPYKKDLLYLAGKVARSSGGFFSKISKSEAKALKLLEGVLGA